MASPFFVLRGRVYVFVVMSTGDTGGTEVGTEGHRSAVSACSGRKKLPIRAKKLFICAL